MRFYFDSDVRAKVPFMPSPRFRSPLVSQIEGEDHEKSPTSVKASTMRITALLLTASLAAQNPNLLTNGSFESGPGGSVTTVVSPSNAVTGWFIFTGSVDHVAEWTTPAGSHSIDLDGFTPGGLQQSIATVAGIPYELSFLMAGNPDSGNVKTMRASAGSTSQVFTFDSTGHDHGNMGWTRMTMTFVASTASTVIEFRSFDPGNYDRGPALDDVAVRALTGTSSAFGAGCLGSNGIPELVPNQPPLLGQPVSTLILHLPANQFALVVVGFDITAYPGPLQSLATYGMPGCSLYSQPDFVDLIPSTGIFGVCVWGQVLPNVTSLVAERFTIQALVSDPSANPAGFSTSNAVLCVVGQ